MEFRLQLFGGLVLSAADGVITGRAAQRRRLGILTLLALAPGQALSRDKLMALLWPEAAVDEARHRLSVALYELRRVLGRDAVVTRGEDVWLDSAVVACDVTEFEDALARGDAERAVRLYAGPFLDGVHLDDAPDFEEWASGVRDRLERAYLAALESVARARARRGDAAGAAEGWRLLARADPYSGRIALELARALDAAGDRAAAIRTAAAHAARLRAELGIEPHREMQEMLQTLRTGGGAGPDRDGAPPEPTARPQPAGASRDLAGAPREPADAASGRVASSADAAARPVVAGDRERRSDTDPGQAVSSADDVAQHALARGEERVPVAAPAVSAGGRSRWLLPLGVVAVVALGLLAPLAAGDRLAEVRQRAAATPPPAHRIAVLPFEVNGAEELAYLGAGMVDLLGIALDGAGDLTAVDAYALLAHLARVEVRSGPVRARETALRFGAGRYVVGSVYGAGGQVRIHARVFDASRPPDAEPVMHAMVEGAATDVLRLVDDLAARLIAEAASAPGAQPARVAAMTTHSLPALKAYLAGEAHFRSGRFLAAADSFRHAAERDTTFALAHYRHALATLWADRDGVSAGDADERALRHGDRLGERERLLLRAYAAWRRGDADEAETLYGQLVSTDPDDVEAWFQLAETLFHYNPLRGRAAEEARAPLERVLHLDPAHRGARWHLALLAARGRRWSEFDDLARHLSTLPQESEQATELAVLRALAPPDPGLDGVVPRLEALPPLRRSVLAWRAAVDLGRWSDADRILALNAGLPHAYWQALAALERADLHLAAGRRRAADSLLAGMPRQLDLVLRILDRRVPPMVVPSFARNDDELRAMESEMADLVRQAIESGARNADRLREFDAYLAGLVRAALGDTAAVRERAAELMRMAATSSAPDQARASAATLRAHYARAAGRPEEALRELETHAVRVWYGLTVNSTFQSMTHERFLRAELLREAGREREALGWYASFGDHTLHDLVYLAPAHFRMAEIHERLGGPEAAARDYARVVELWGGSDAETAALAAEARRRLRRLPRPASR